jgi:hypothetical protein
MKTIEKGVIYDTDDARLIITAALGEGYTIKLWLTATEKWLEEYEFMDENNTSRTKLIVITKEAALGLMELIQDDADSFVIHECDDYTIVDVMIKYFNDMLKKES